MARTHVFRAVLDRDPTEDDELLGRLLAAMPLLELGTEDGHPVAALTVPGATFADAIAAGITTLAEHQVRVIRLYDHDLLSLEEIAVRAGRSREAVRRYTTGERGPGGFPPPVNPGRDGTRFWRWTEAAPWLTQIGIDVGEADATLALANVLLQARDLRPRVVSAEALLNLLELSAGNAPATAKRGRR